MCQQTQSSCLTVTIEFQNDQSYVFEANVLVHNFCILQNNNKGKYIKIVWYNQWNITQP